MDRQQPTVPRPISPWTAEFRNRSTEAAYRRRNSAAYVRHARFGLGLWAVLLLLFIYSDYNILGPDSGFWILLSSRVSMSFAITVVSVFLGRYPGLVQKGHGMALLLALGWTGFFPVFLLYPPEMMPWNIAMTMAMLMGQFVFIPLRITHGALIALYAIAGTLFCDYWVAGAGTSDLAGLFLMLLVPTATGLFVAYRFKLDHRWAFALLLDSEEANAQLQREIRRRQQLEEELTNQAHTDPLTGLANRRHYEVLFRRELKRAKRHGQRLSLLILDLDHFKQFNDRNGHSAGDDALQVVARVCRFQLRETDIIGRLGGEEIVAILPHTGLEHALEVAERLREAIAGAGISPELEQEPLTATFGAAELEARDRDIEDLIRRADAALYKGKSLGRNRVEAN